MLRLKSDIPANATERFLRKERRKDVVQFRIMDCVLKGKVVGRRCYTPEGKLVAETPLKNGKAHGRAFIWAEDGRLELVEPYYQGKVHGTARQFGNRGKVIGTYKLIHGTGLDVWRIEHGGRASVSEIHSIRNGVPDGCELWFGFVTKAPRLWHERFWCNGKLHGVERMWNAAGKLCGGYPRYWARGRRVAKRMYTRMTGQDKRLQPIRKEDDSPHRNFSPQIERILSR